MTDDELREYIVALRRARTDLRHVEAKRARSQMPTRLWETLSAFANSPGGGIIILGLDEQSGFTVTGVEDARKMFQDLGSMSADMEPRLTPLIEIKEVDGRHLIVAEVPELLPNHKPCYYRSAGLVNGAFVRVADGDRKLNTYEVQLMLASRGQPKDDQEPVPDADEKDLDRTALADFFTRVRNRRTRLRSATEAQIMRTLKIVVPHPDDDTRFVPSIAGLLVFGAAPQEFFPQFAVLVTAFPGRNIGELGPHGERMLDDARIEGPIGSMIGEALIAIGRNMRKPRIQAGHVRVLESEIPLAALTEAIVNALAHRDLSPTSRGAAVQIQLFEDRMTIVNPGGLFGALSVDTLGAGGHTSARNTVLMQLLEDVTIPGTRNAIVEHRGTGIPLMMQALRMADMSPPQFEDNIGTFKVTFPRLSLIDPEILQWLASLKSASAGLSRDQRMALASMKGGEIMSNARYRQINGVDSRVASRELMDLVDRKLAETIGSGRYTEYLLAADVEEDSADNAGATQTRADRRDEIRELLAQHGALSRAELQAELRISQPGVSKWIRRMLDENEIELTTESEKSPDTKYRLRKKKGRGNANP